MLCVNLEDIHLNKYYKNNNYIFLSIFLPSACCRDRINNSHIIIKYICDKQLYLCKYKKQLLLPQEVIEKILKIDPNYNKFVLCQTSLTTNLFLLKCLHKNKVITEEPTKLKSCFLRNGERKKKTVRFQNSDIDPNKDIDSNKDSFKKNREKNYRVNLYKKSEIIDVFKNEDEFHNHWKKIVKYFLSQDLVDEDVNLTKKIQITNTYTTISYLMHWKNPSLYMPLNL